MSDQLDFFSSIKISMPQKGPNCLFVAVRPDKHTARRLTQVAAEVLRSRRMSGKVQDAERFHVTLQYINHYAEVPGQVINDLSGACETAATRGSPFDVKFDRVMSFGRAVVLTGLKHDEANPELQLLHRSLWLELKKTRVRIEGSSALTPHVTLLYGSPAGPEEPVEPVSWRVAEMELILSEQGAHRHHVLGRWELGGSL